MNWIRENKFLTGFIAVLVIGAGVLGWLLYSAWSQYNDVSDQYTQAAGQLKQLQDRVPYPDQENLAKYQEELKTVSDATQDLVKNLSTMVLPVKEISNFAFQDQLRDAVAAVEGKAKQAGVKLPDKFALDFDQYQASPPAADAASPLGRQLSAIQLAMNILCDDRIESVTSLKRGHLPQEGGGARQPGGGGFQKPNQPSAPQTGGMVDKVSFDLNFTATQSAFQRVLSDFAASNQQFFITRTLIIDNSDPKPKTKGDAGTAAPSQPGASGTDGGSTLQFLVGTERLNVAMRVDMVSFNPPGQKGGKR